jgi:hypothetical protein
LDNSVIEVTDFNSLQIPGNYFIRFTSGTGNKPTDRTGGYGSLIVKNIGNTYLEQILTTYYKNKMHQYKRRAIKNGNSWSFIIGGEEEDKNNKALWVRTYNNSAIIPLEDGGTGTSFSAAPDNALIIKKTVTKDEESKPQLDYKKTNKGALHCKT